MMRRKRRGMMPEAKFLSDLPEHERHDPGDKHLKAQAIKFERENSPKDYRQMRGCWFKSSNETRIYYHAPRQRYSLLDAI